MDLDKALRLVDPAKVAERFDEVMLTEYSDDTIDSVLTHKGRQTAYERYPIFSIIRDKFEEATAPEGLIPRERLTDIMAGMDILAVVITAVALSDSPEERSN